SEHYAQIVQAPIYIVHDMTNCSGIIHLFSLSQKYSDSVPRQKRSSLSAIDHNAPKDTSLLQIGIQVVSRLER
ncbi:hypothetical protein VN97_g7067, partial [Penicillium thymicola]